MTPFQQNEICMQCSSPDIYMPTGFRHFLAEQHLLYVSLSDKDAASIHKYEL